MTSSRPLRVLALIDSLNWGGAEMLLADFARGCALADMRLSVAYLAEQHGSPAAARLRAAGVEPILVPVGGLLRASSLRRVRRLLRALVPDLVHTHLAYADILGGAAARSLGIPSVSTVHVMQWERGARERAKAVLAARARRHCAGRVIAVSESARGAYLATGWDAPQRVVTVRNGTAARARPGAGAAVRAQLGIGADELVVGMVTVLRPGKGHDRAIAAAAALRASFPRLRLLVAGDGPAGEEVRAMAAAALGDGAIFTGHRDDVMEVLDALDVLVHPTLVDAFPTILLEAQAAGVPILASAVGGIPEIVEDGVSGILLRPRAGDDELVRMLTLLLADPRRRARLAAGGRAHHERDFMAARWAQRMRRVYDPLVARNPAPTRQVQSGTRHRGRAAPRPSRPT
ncbi:MAG TPA: glycosyltransferase family 4 protein [Solirubrobacteraceae bacterium]|nr:glycosyltransferase family 4 protein [Solirubrobacteraceae bacterium]